MFKQLVLEQIIIPPVISAHSLALEVTVDKMLKFYNDTI
jgi:hypothetical protein